MIKRQMQYRLFAVVIPLTERVMGIEPTFSAWEADVLPLNYTRKSRIIRGTGEFYRKEGLI